MEKVDLEIVVTDTEPKVFKALLHFIYRDTLIEDEELYMLCLPFLPLVSESFPAKLLVAAEKYDLPRLKLMCESVLCNEISIDSVAYILAFAHRYGANELKSRCLHFTTENLYAVMKAVGFEYLKENCPLLQSEPLKSKAGCEEKSSDRNARQRTLKNEGEVGQSSRVHLSDGVNKNTEGDKGESQS